MEISKSGTQPQYVLPLPVQLANVSSPAVAAEVVEIGQE